MSDIVEKNRIDRFVQTEKTNYKIPESFLGKLDNIPSYEDFYKGYSTTQDEIPLWWTRDVDLPLTKKETKRARKETIAIQRALENHQIRLERANRQYLKILEKQERQFKERCLELDKQVELKKEELEMLHKHNKLEFENRLLELELELQQINREKQYYEREQKRLKELEEKKLKFKLKEQDWEETLASIDSEIRSTSQEKDKLKDEAQKELKEIGIPIEEIEKEELPKPKDKFEYFEKFDPANILEVKHITLTNKENGYNELYNISFNVKKSGITVVCSKSTRLLRNLEMAIMRTLPSHLRVSAGQIMLNGADIGEVLRTDYRQFSKNLIISLTNIQDKLSRSTKKFSNALEGYKIDNHRLNKAFEVLGLDKSLKSKKLSKLSVEQKEKVTLAALFSMTLALKILFEPQQDMDTEQREKLIELINSSDDSTARLILTSDMALAVELDNCSLYTL